MCKDAVQVDGSATPGWAGGETPGIGATPKKQRSRWDETPMGVAPSATPMMGATPSMTPGATPLMTPGMAAGMETPSPSAMQPGVSEVNVVAWQQLVHALMCRHIQAGFRSLHAGLHACTVLSMCHSEYMSCIVASLTAFLCKQGFTNQSIIGSSLTVRSVLEWCRCS